MSRNSADSVDPFVSTNLKKIFGKNFRNFNCNIPWIWAKTYANMWPHYYIVRVRVDEKLFVTMVQHIDILQQDIKERRRINKFMIPEKP